MRRLFEEVQFLSATGRRLVILAAVASLSATACGGSTVSPGSPSTTPLTPAGSAAANATPTAPPPATPIPVRTFAAAVVTRYDDTRDGLEQADLEAAYSAGSVLVPCEFESVTLGTKALTLPSSTKCLAADQITAQLATKADSKSGALALLPPGLVTPSVKVLAVGGADLFGGPKKRALPYPLSASGALPDSSISYDSNAVTTLISTGDTCPDRGVSYMAVTKKKTWEWILNGGTARYRGFKTSDWDWPVPILARNGDYGAVKSLMADSDIGVNDFECPVIAKWTQHDTGKVFTVAPEAAQLLATDGGVKVVTLGSNHITDAGLSGITETISILDSLGVKHTGAGATLTDALAPAVLDVRGIKFAFVGWDDIEGSRGATATRAGVAPMTDENVCSSIKAARQVADVVIAMPQWGWPEYHANITKTQIAQRKYFYDCGADGILGSGTHWASWVSILPGENGPLWAIGSHGNFLFDQSWSRQTMEGVIVEATFSGKKLVQFRLHPYVIVQGAQPNLINSTDGAYVLDQVWSKSEVK
jgi:poly-gamma-glutamate capsule biosynthesis protein CapA/YwtB (metallophosphatase superfamily)